MGTADSPIPEMRVEAERIITDAIASVLPYGLVADRLKAAGMRKPVTLVSIGKAAWTMASAAVETLGEQVVRGIVLTKDGHSLGPIGNLEILEAGHPIPDERSVDATNRILNMTGSLGTDEQIVLLLSGGGSALFELPMDGVELEDIVDVTDQLLASGANIVEINTVRKRLSAVKAGRFAAHCAEIPILAIALSDVLGNRMDAIASGPVSPDPSTAADVMRIVERYRLQIGDTVRAALLIETPKTVDNCEAIVAGSVDALCESAASEAARWGYKPLVLTTSLECEAREAGCYMASLAKQIRKSDRSAYGIEPPCAIIAGGETVVRLTGKGKGGRNQELALAAALGIDGLESVVVVAVGSDGTDGPTDAAGGLVDGGSARRIAQHGTEPEVFLDDNDSYHALLASGDLMITGPTGTNVNDLVLLMCR